MPEDNVGTFVLTKHPNSLIGEVKRAVQAMPRFGKALVVGAHIGTIAVPLASHCSELVAIEPNPRSFELLQLNAAMNGRDNMVLVNVAANDKEEDIEFIVRYDNSGGSGRMPVHKDPEWLGGKHDVIYVAGRQLDVVLADYTFDLVFMDCEGSEVAAFNGMQRILADAQSLIVEFMGKHIARVAGVTVADFLAPLRPHFQRLYIPTTGKWVAPAQFESVLSEMADAGKDDAGLIFMKGK